MAPELQDGNQARIFVDTYKGKRAVVKTVPHPNRLIVSRLERWMIQREVRALKRLEDVKGVPDLLGIPDDNSIAIEYRSGVNLREADPSELAGSFFRELEHLVRTIHDHGVVHSDLKKKDNIIVGNDNRPVLVDFGTHFIRKETLNPLKTFLYEQCKQMDLNAVSKLKKQLRPEDMKERDHRRLDSPTLLERADRFRRNYLWDW